MPKYDGLRKANRDRRIKKFAALHYNWSQQEIANHFHLSRSNISRILASK